MLGRGFDLDLFDLDLLELLPVPPGPFVLLFGFFLEDDDLVGLDFLEHFGFDLSVLHVGIANMNGFIVADQQYRVQGDRIFFDDLLVQQLDFQNVAHFHFVLPLSQ